MRDVGEARTIEDLRDALGSSLDLRKALEAARPLLLRAVPADYLAVGVTKADRLEELDWFASEMPAGFLDTYDEMAPHDFVPPLRGPCAEPRAAGFGHDRTA